MNKQRIEYNELGNHQFYQKNKRNMKNIYITLGLLLIFSCNNKDSKPTTTIQPQSYAVETSTTQQTNSNTEHPGFKLVKNSDCLACHKTKQKLVGPSYHEIAIKYTHNDTTQLAQAIIKGGSGTWGSVPMTPHPDLSQEDATLMVKYILSLKE